MDEQKAKKVVEKVHNFIMMQRAIEYVPWVTDPDSDTYDPKKHGIDIGRNEVIKGIEEIYNKVFETNPE